MKTSFLRIVATLILIQFSNVQVQTAFGSDAITAQNSEIQYALQRAKSRIAEKVEKLTEEKQVQLAYRLYRHSVRLRNRLHGKTERQFQQRLHQLEAREGMTDEPVSAEDIELTSMLKDDLGVESVQNEFQSAPAPSRKDIRRQRILNDSDAVLLSLGAKTLSNGKLFAASAKEFSDRLQELESREEQSLRGPASIRSFILKVLLSLLIITAGAALFVICLAILGLIAFYGGTGAIWVILLMVAIVAGTFFGVRAVLSEHRRLGPSQHSFSA